MGAEIKKTIGIAVKKLMFLVKALLISLFLLAGKKLQQVYRPAIAFN